MLQKLHKSLQKYLSKIKTTGTQNLKSMLSGCKHHLQTLSFAVERGENQETTDFAATLSDIDRFLFENFPSLYPNDDHQENNVGYLSDSPRCNSLPPNLRGTDRFFVTPGRSSSVLKDAGTSITMSSSNKHAGASSMSTGFNDDHRNIELTDDCIAVCMHSESPYDDFRVSMQEMMETKMQQSGRIDWDYLEELLFCYLNLNDKCTHKYILSAFVDLVAGFWQRVPEG